MGLNLKLATPLAIGIAILGYCIWTKFNESRTFSGIWLVQFEGSMFMEGATEVPKTHPDYAKASSLNYDPAKLKVFDKVANYVEPINCYPVRAYALTFVGRKKIGVLGSGHMGLLPSEVDVERMIAVKPLGPPFCYDS